VCVSSMPAIDSIAILVMAQGRKGGRFSGA
jgi:hypothetical protein